jgi:hypothetical protein
MANNSINSGLPAQPFHADLATLDELRSIYNAININQQILSDSTRFVAKALEAITAGQYVSVVLDAGLCKVQKANAANNTKIAVGYSLNTIAAGDWGIFITTGNNNLLTGLTVGSYYYLSDSSGGDVTTTKPVGVGKTNQCLGFALTSTELISNISLPFVQL